jgi:hypothetical protein
MATICKLAPGAGSCAGILTWVLMPNTRLPIWTIHNDPTYNHESITVVGVDPLGRVWFTSPYNYAPVIMFDGQYWHHIIPENGCDYWVREGALDTAGQLWLSTWAGLCRYDGDTWTRYRRHPSVSPRRS